MPLEFTVLRWLIIKIVCVADVFNKTDHEVNFGLELGQKFSQFFKGPETYIIFSGERVSS